MALLPKKEGNDFLKNSLCGLNFSEVYQNRKNTKVLVNMPEFKYDFSEDLTKYLESLGMEKVFTSGADFSPMTDEWIKADGIIHKAYIEVDRKGTKAAAVIAMMMFAGCAPDFNIPIVRLDRPFIYAIMNNETGLPVFVGLTSKFLKKWLLIPVATLLFVLIASAHRISGRLFYYQSNKLLLLWITF